VTPAPGAPALDEPTTRTVEPGDSLWEIVQQTYGVSDVGAIVSMVDLVFDSNRDQLSDPSELDVGVVLRLPTPGA
jgi:nucleoid-associated protein YgaU